MRFLEPTSRKTSRLDCMNDSLERLDNIIILIVFFNSHRNERLSYLYTRLYFFILTEIYFYFTIDQRFIFYKSKYIAKK